MLLHILLIACLIMLLLSITLSIFVIRYFKRMDDKLTGYISLIYDNNKRNENMSSDMNDLSTEVKTINETVTSLTSSIRSLVTQHKVEKEKEKIYPGPQLLELIDKCITENILMTASLIQQQQVPDDPVVTVSEILLNTFPHVNENYLQRRVIYIMNEFNNSRTGRPV